MFRQLLFCAISADQARPVLFYTLNGKFKDFLCAVSVSKVLPYVCAREGGDGKKGGNGSGRERGDAEGR